MPKTFKRQLIKRQPKLFYNLFLLTISLCCYNHNPWFFMANGTADGTADGNAVASTTIPSSSSEKIIIDSLWKKIFDQSLPEEAVATVATIPPPAPAPADAIVTERPATPTLSVGELRIQEAMKKNREALLARRNNANIERAKTSSTMTTTVSNAEKKEEDFSTRSFVEEMRGQEKNFQQGAAKETRETLDNWRSDIQQTYARWATARNDFLKNIEMYKQNEFSIPDVKPQKGKEIKTITKTVPKKPVTPVRSITQPARPVLTIQPTNKQSASYHIVSHALDFPVKDQKNRPTCSVFAGIRAIEILARQQGKNLNLSEQYFYWASRPDCRNAPCNVRGSSVVPGYDFSKSNSSLDIPLAKDCPYQENPRDGNETQIPLNGGCLKGVAGVVEYEYFDSVDELIKALDNNHPVVASFTLSEDFYKSEGYIVTGGARGTGEHSNGHTVLVVGYILYPNNNNEINTNPKLKNQGRLCFLIANSWGEGHGRGGHSCISEAWFNQHRTKASLIALTAIRSL
ncbi:MAG: C1 family peptidase [Oligoflexia bacterium]|nr:C1 family peptidase [Oligoflexia bacterium]